MTTEKSLVKKRTGAPLSNGNALRHGLYSRDKNILKLRARSVRRLVDKAYALCAWLGPADRPTVQAWAEAVKLKSVAFVALEASNPYRVQDGDIVGRRLLTDYARLAQLELSFARELGLTPLSRATLRVSALEGDSLASRASRLRDGDG